MAYSHLHPVNDFIVGCVTCAEQSGDVGEVGEGGVVNEGGGVGPVLDLT